MIYAVLEVDYEEKNTFPCGTLYGLLPKGTLWRSNFMKEIGEVNNSVRSSSITDEEWTVLVKFSKILEDIDDILDSELSAITGVS